MKKRLLSMLCIAALLLCLLPQTAFAAGNLEGVDYDRIGGTGSRVTLTLGELVFEGQLSRGSMVSESEQDKIIKQTMNDLHITSGMLLNAKSMLDAAHKLEGFSIKDVTNAMLKLTGAQDAIDLYKLVMGENTTPSQIAGKIAQDQIKGQAQDFVQNQMEDVLTQGGKVALKGMGKYAFKLLFMLPDLTEIGLNALAKYENIKETCAIALERQLLLDTFYDECNRRIAEASGDRGAWEIRFDKRNTQTYNCTFWGISGVMMEASLSGVLEQVSEIDGAAGMYRGTLWLDIDGVDMKNSFDAKFAHTSPYDQPMKYVIHHVQPGATDKYQETILNRKAQGEISVMITGGNGTQVSELSGGLTSGGDEIEFAFDHLYEGEKNDSSVPYWSSYYYAAYHYTANTLGTVTTAQTVYSETFGPNGYYRLDGSKAPEVREDSIPDIGTVWKPLESTPYITVYY